jgi:hypothetical protein
MPQLRQVGLEFGAERWIVAVRDSLSIEIRRLMLRRLSVNIGRGSSTSGLIPPTMFVPPPNGIKQTSRRCASCTMASTCACESGKRTASGARRITALRTENRSGKLLPYV